VEKKEQMKTNRTHRRKTELVHKENGLYLSKKNDKGGESTEKVFICEYLAITRIFSDLVRKTVKIELSYYMQGMLNKIVLERAVLAHNLLRTELFNLGIGVTESNFRLIQEWLLYTEEVAEICYTHSDIGWHHVNGKKVYLLDRYYGPDPIESEYNGDLDLKPKGTLEKFKDLIFEEVKGRTQLELAFVIGLASIVVSYLKDILSSNVFLFHFTGDSSTGKTSSSQLSLSSYGLPRKTKGGLMKNFNSTDNAIMGYIKNKHGFCFCLDEASSRFNNDFTQFIYVISDGLTKGRANIDGSTREIEEYSGIFIFTGENSILENSGKANGLQMRVTELSFDAWTSSPENAKNIVAGITKNYGHTAKILAKQILEIGEEKLIQRFNDAKETVVARFTEKDRFLDRISDKLAVIYLTSMLVNESLDFEFDSLGIVDLLIEAETEKMEDRIDLGDAAYAVIMESVTRYQGDFYRGQVDDRRRSVLSFEEQIVTPKQLKGRIDYDEDGPKAVYITSAVLNEFLKDHKFASTTVVVKALKRKGYLLQDVDGKNQIKKKLYKEAPVPVRVYGLKINDTVKKKIEVERNLDNGVTVTGRRKSHAVNSGTILFDDEDDSPVVVKKPKKVIPKKSIDKSEKGGEH